MRACPMLRPRWAAAAGGNAQAVALVLVPAAVAAKESTVALCPALSAHATAAQLI